VAVVDQVEIMAAEVVAQEDSAPMSAAHRYRLQAERHIRLWSAQALR
jgi:hypothetical protein